VAQNGAAETEVTRSRNLNLHKFEACKLPDRRAIGKRLIAWAVALIAARGLTCGHPISFSTNPLF
jgi:hypothetical protein